MMMPYAEVVGEYAAIITVFSAMVSPVFPMLSRVEPTKTVPNTTLSKPASPSGAFPAASSSFLGLVSSSFFSFGGGVVGEGEG